MICKHGPAAVMALILTTVAVPFASAQDIRQAIQLTTQELRLRDGSILYGSIEEQTETTIVFRTIAGMSVTVPRAEILSLRTAVGTVVNSEFQPADPNGTRLFYGPTGRALPKGRTYLGVYEFVMPCVQVGVTDRFSIGGGTPLVFGINDWERPFWITPKFQVLANERVQLSVGVFQAFAGGDGGGIAYTVATAGRADSSVTGGVGLAYGNDGGRAGVVMVGAERRLRRNLKFITENYVWEGGSGFLMGGVRFFGERLSADLGIAVPVGAGEFIGVPVVNFVYVF